MEEYWYIHLLRVLISVLLGFAIGLERKARFKEAGIRTHALVCAGACIIMLVSKYGFIDSPDFDASRIASQIVSGIGFIGAGMIMYRKRAVQGLTTAAGIWATAGIGMAIGAGMYILGAVSAVVIIITQCVFHLPFRFFRLKQYSNIKLTFTHSEENLIKIKEIFKVDKFTKITIRRMEIPVCTVTITTEKNYSEKFLCDLMENNQFIESFESVDE